MDQKQIDYLRIEKAIHFICDNFTAQPSLDEIAAAVNMSAFHFQKMFQQWAGISPKKFVQYMSLEHAKGLLKARKSLSEVAFNTGLSGTSRLHDLFVSIEGMTPGEFKNGGVALPIYYAFASSPFGALIVAATDKGVCHLSFEAEPKRALAFLQQRFPNASLQHKLTQHQQNALQLFQQDWGQLEQIKLHLHGTQFQLKVWESLLKIPLGGLNTYRDIAQALDNPKAYRAVGSAIGRNPIAFIIPCHRVIQNSGQIGGYAWGTVKKRAIIGWESAKLGHHNGSI